MTEESNRNSSRRFAAAWAGSTPGQAEMNRLKDAAGAAGFRASALETCPTSKPALVLG